MLKTLRKHIRDDGKLFFSAFIEEQLDGFDDRVKEHPLRKAYYGKDYMMSLIEEAGWRIEAFYDMDPDRYIREYFVCSPEPSHSGS